MTIDVLKITNELDKLISDKQEIEVLKRLLLIEVKHNLNLIFCLKLEELNQKSEEILIIVEHLEIDVLMLFLSDNIKKKSLLSKLLQEYKKTKDDESNDLILNIILKVKILKSIKKLPYNNSKIGFKDFRLKKRLENLQDNLHKLRIILEK
jgi:hypothetical protein